MDDIAACIKDHQYNEAIRATVVDPEEALAKAIIEKIPSPGKDVELQDIEKYVEGLKLENLISNSLGRYFLCEIAVEQDSSLNAEAVKELQDALDSVDEVDKNSAKSKIESMLSQFSLLCEKATFSTFLKPVHAKVEDAVKVHFAKADAFRDKIEVEEKKLEEEADGDSTKQGISEDKDKDKDKETTAEGGSATPDSDKPDGDAEQGSPDTESDVSKPFQAFIEVFKDNFFSKYFQAFKDHPLFPSKYRDTCWYRDRAVTMDDFVIFRDLGRGAFGVVSGARNRVTGQMVALKGMNRKLIKGKKVLKMVKVEFMILKTLGERPSPFCVSLLYSFIDATDLYLGLPLCTGGDLMYHLRNNRYGYGVERSRFFAAQILLAIEHLHNLGILYRDLKPENVLLDDKGHTKISDMGLAVLTGHTPKTIGNHLMHGRAGTPGYWPPEMIQKKGYAFDSDWWSYGVMLFEFLTGICAFSESYTKCKDRNEATLTYEIKFPGKSGDSDTFPESAKDLILLLLDRNRSTRLGAKPNAVSLVKAHPFFETIDWESMSLSKVAPPWVPPGDSINAASQEELQERSKEHEFKNLKLSEEDNIEGIAYSSRHHEKDLVEVLRLEAKGKLKHLEPSSSSGICTIL